MRSRRFDHRPGLPSGRSVVGGLLIAVAALGTFAVAGGDADPLPPGRVVTRRAVAPGDVIGPADLELVPSDGPGGGAHLFGSVDDVAGAVALAPLDPGDLVQRSAVRPADPEAPGDHQVSFPVDRSGAVGGRLQLGERVDVVATYGTGIDATTRRVARGALVVAADATDDRLGTALVVTLAVPDPDDALRVTHAANAGAIALVRTDGGAEGTLEAYRTPRPTDDADTGRQP